MRPGHRHVSLNRLLDMTNVLSGPYAGYQLALMGADVIKLEIPGTGDLARRLGADPRLSGENLGVSFLAQNAGKRSVTVNLKHASGREVFTRLLGEADVLLENFRPGVLDKLGFGWERLRETPAWSTARCPASAPPGPCASAPPTTR